MRLAIAYGAIFALVLSLMGFYLVRELERQMIEHLADSLLREARVTSHLFEDLEPVLANQHRIQQVIKEVGRDIKTRITVIDANGQVIGDSLRDSQEIAAMDNHAGRPEFRSALAGTPASSVRRSRTFEMNMLYVAVPLMKGDKPAGALRLALSLGQVEEVLSSTGSLIAAGTIVGIVIAVIFSVLLGRSTGKRITEISWAACRYADGDLSRKIFVKGDDEIRLLAHAMNQMAHALKRRIFETETERKKLMLVLENMAEGVIAVNGGRDIVLANASAEGMFQSSPGAAAGKSLLAFTKKPLIDETMAEAVANETQLQKDIEITQPETRMLRGYFVGMRSEPGDICGIVVLSDMTQIRRLENLRREFVANVGHELRTPLTSIRGFIETLLNGALEDPSAGRRFLQMMQEDALRLERLIADLMELSKLEARQAGLEKQPLAIEEEVEHAAESLKPLLLEKKIRFSNHIRRDSAPRVMADRDRIRQVLVNLLDNAIKFNRTGGEIHVDASVERQYLKISVKDTGTGIPEEAIGRLFERFFRVDKARSRELGGTGLGLSIVKHIVESHGGSVGCMSEPGRGSTFFFSLPLAGPAEKNGPA